MWVYLDFFSELSPHESLTGKICSVWQSYTKLSRGIMQNIHSKQCSTQDRSSGSEAGPYIFGICSVLISGNKNLKRRSMKESFYPLLIYSGSYFRDILKPEMKVLLEYIWTKISCKQPSSTHNQVYLLFLTDRKFYCSLDLWGWFSSSKRNGILLPSPQTCSHLSVTTYTRQKKKKKKARNQMFCGVSHPKK